MLFLHLLDNVERPSPAWHLGIHSGSEVQTKASARFEYVSFPQVIATRDMSYFQGNPVLATCERF